MLGNYALFSHNTSNEIRLLNIIGSSIGVMLIFTLLLDITMLLVIQRHIPSNKAWRFRAILQTISLILILVSWGPYINGVTTMTSLKQNNSEFKFRPVGVVQTEIKDEDVGSTRKTSIKTIWIDPRFESALEGIEQYSHIFVLFWMIKNNKNRPLSGFQEGIVK